MSKAADINPAIQLNGVDRESFVSQFGALYECSPWIAERAFAQLSGGLINKSIPLETLLYTLREVVSSASQAEQLALICAHPDLAGRAAVRGELTAESTEEQSRARLDQCSSAEFDEFQQLNTDYKAKFEFPFIMAVRNCERAEILAAFRTRLQDNKREEFNRALDNIHMIAKLRLQASLGI